MKLTYKTHLGSDTYIVDTARVSFSKEASQYTEEQNIKLLKYLAKHEHWSPFAHPQISIHVKIPIFMARQWFKHIVGSVKNEVSRRYVDSEPEFWIPNEFRSRSTSGAKQGSGEPSPNGEAASHIYNLAIVQAKCQYNTLIHLGVCPEQARAVLPLATYTEFIDTGSLYYWSRIYNQRSDTTAQKEWETLTNQLDTIIRPLFPQAWEVLTGED